MKKKNRVAAKGKPKKLSEKKANNSSKAGQPGFSPLKLLIMDDSLFFTEMLVCCFSKIKEYNVLGVAYSKGQLLDLTRKFRPHVLIMDLSMPGIDSLKTLREFKQSNPDSRVIVCSGLSGENIIMQCLLNGVEDFITKPFSIDRLLYSLRS